ncbi:MAG: hypothetical protein ACOH10_13660 [Rhodoglobus sp.]
MAAIPQATLDHYRAMQRLQVLAVAAGRRSWRGVDPRFLSESWARSVAVLTPVISAVQIKAAEAGASYGAQTLAEQGSWVAPESFVNPKAFGGFASDGRPLNSLLYSAAPGVKDLISGGMSVQQALSSGRGLLDRIIQTQVADAGRQAASADIAARVGVGYVRMLNPPSCPACTILAGKFFRWNAGFKRHNRCDCVHVASSAGSTQAARDEGLIDNPYDYFHGMTGAEQNRVFGEHSAQAIRDGADIFQVENAKRGMSTVNLYGRQTQITTEGITKRGNARAVMGSKSRTPARLTPDSIYELATDRADAMRLLEKYGYTLPGGQNPLGSIVGQHEGFGALGGGGARKAASQAVVDARASGIRDGSRYTMTEAERRLYDAEQRWLTVLDGKNPYGSPGFGNTPDPFGLRRNGSGAGPAAPLTPAIAAQVEKDYRRWLATNGEIFKR